MISFYWPVLINSWNVCLRTKSYKNWINQWNGNRLTTSSNYQRNLKKFEKNIFGFHWQTKTSVISRLKQKQDFKIEKSKSVKWNVNNWVRDVCGRKMRSKWNNLHSFSVVTKGVAKCKQKNVLGKIECSNFLDSFKLFWPIWTAWSMICSFGILFKRSKTYVTFGVKNLFYWWSLNLLRFMKMSF